MATNFIGTLLENSPAYNVTQGFSTRLYDAAGSQTISVSAGASLSLVGSMGSNIIQLAGNASTWQVMRDGSTAILTNAQGDRVEVPATLQAQTIQFADKAASLQIDVSSGTPAVKLGAQTLAGNVQAVAAWDGGAPASGDGSSVTKTPWTLVMVHRATEGNRLFVSDGTAQGTGIAANSQMNHSYLEGGLVATEDRSKAFLVQGPDAIVSDGTADGTIKLKSTSSFTWKTVIGNQLVAGGMSYAGTQSTPVLLISDGTMAGTKWMDGIPVPDSSRPLHIDKVNKKVWFVSQTVPYGSELSVIDLEIGGGTARVVKDIRPGQASGVDSPTGGTLLSGKFVFLGHNGVDGSDLWISDGTESGTNEISDLSNQYNYVTPQFVALGNKWVFPANLAGGEHGAVGYKLVVTDGTRAGTTVLDGNYAPVQMVGTAGSKLYFTGTVAGENFTWTPALFSTDGLAVTKITDIASDAALLAQTPGKLFFRSSDSAHGSELWVSDLATSSFSLVKDILPGSGSSLTFSNESFVVGDKLAFTAYTDAFKKSFFVSDGTASGTIALSSAVVTHYAAPAATDYLIFADSNGVHGVDTSDLVPSPTRLVSETLSVFPTHAMQRDIDDVFFQTALGNLYSTDGSTAGTSKLAGNVIKFKVVAEDALFFIQRSSAGGLSLWYSDGSTTGTQFVEELPSGPLDEWRYDLEQAVAVRTVGVPEQT